MASPFSRFSVERTPYAVHCKSKCGLIYLTTDEYNKQMYMPDAKWMCPKCGSDAEWDDDNYEDFFEA